jgi:hypothetical protein
VRVGRRPPPDDTLEPCFVQIVYIDARIARRGEHEPPTTNEETCSSEGSDG